MRQRRPLSKLRSARRAQRDSVAPRANYAARITRNATALPHVQTTQRASRATCQCCPTCKLRSARRAQCDSIAPHANYTARVGRNAPAHLLGGREVFLEGMRYLGREGGILEGREVFWEGGWYFGKEGDILGGRVLFWEGG
ncbi:MAG: hypothetical protein GY820_00195 [Gammaproteobacteria bacterium]|nr:hypothetical protein [Gammaproteobacteria bacterium]